MPKDYIPSADGELTTWLRLFKANVAKDGANLGLTPAEIAQAAVLCDEYVEQINIADVAAATAKSQNTKKKSMRKTHLGPLRKMINRMKRSANYSMVDASSLKLKGHGYQLNEETYQPVLSQRIQGDLIEIKFKKRGIQALEFWGQFNGGEWKFIGTKIYSPAYFKPDNPEQGKAMLCKIKAIGIVKDKQFGQWSQPITVLYGAE